MTDIDNLLRTRLARAAVPADPSGVADAIRARLAAGDAGTPAPAGGARGPGFDRSPLSRWLPWVSLILVGGLVGASLGVSGAFGTAPWIVIGAANSDSPVGVPSDGAIPLESGSPSLEPELPSTAPTSTPSASPQPSENAAEPAAPAPKPPKVDSVAPKLSQAWVAPTEVYNGELVSAGVIASDNVAVTGVSVSWSGPTTTGNGTMTSLGGGKWGFEFNPSADDYGNYTITMRATDARGNTSKPVTVQFLHVFFG